MTTSATVSEVRELTLAERAGLTEQEKQVIAQTIFPGANTAELNLYLHECMRRGVHPLDRRIHPQVRTSRDGKRSVAFVTSIDQFREVAIASGKYDGTDGPYWCGRDGIWRDVWLAAEPPAASRYVIHRIGAAHPFVAVALWSEYAQVWEDSGKPKSTWAKMPALMLAKCAEALALRKAFPQELGGLYAKEEMDQAEPAKQVEARIVDPAPEKTKVDGTPSEIGSTMGGAVEGQESATQEPTRGTITDAQLRAIYGFSTRLGATTKEEIIALIFQVCAAKITSPDGISKQKASAIISALKTKCDAEPKPRPVAGPDGTTGSEEEPF